MLCWNASSISCLESWSRWLQWSLVIGGLLGGLIGIGLLWISNRIDVLKADRAFTVSQIQTITNILKDKPRANFRLSVIQGNIHDAMQYGVQLQNALEDAGWTRKSWTGFYLDAGEIPPSGITIKTDGRNKDAETSARHLETALNAAQVEDVKLVIDPTLEENLEAPPWVLIVVGPKALDAS